MLARISNVSIPDTVSVIKDPGYKDYRFLVLEDSLDKTVIEIPKTLIIEMYEYMRETNDRFLTEE
jgi:hypothetical protein